MVERYLAVVPLHDGSNVNNPPHPGPGIRYDIEAMGWTVAECAKRLGLSRTTLSRILNG